MSWQIIESWRSLPGVHATHPDPYLVWAQVTGWAELVPSASPNGLAVPDIPLIVEFDGPMDLEAFRKLAKGLLSVPAAYGKSARFIAVRANALGLAALAHAAAGGIGERVLRFDLCAFARPRRPPMKRFPAAAVFVPTAQPAWPVLNAKKLIGVVDDSCVFAHPGFVHNGSTRIASIWDQSRHPAFSSGDWGHEPAHFPYGREIWREPHDGSAGLDALLAAHPSGSGSGIDESGCYDTAGLRSLRRAASHGAHVMDVLAGPRRLRDRIVIDRSDPPTWDKAYDPAADRTQSDMVFVQLPRDGIQDSSGVWLDAHLLDAVHYVRSCALAAKVDQAVVNISYGATVGPHDGSSIFAKALEDVVKNSSGLDLTVTLAAGNAFGVRSHATVKIPSRASAKFQWRVCPGSEAVAFLQIWIPESAAAVRLRVTPPGARADDMPFVEPDTTHVWTSSAVPPATLVYLKSHSRGEGRMALLAVAPTLIDDDPSRACAPHGVWRLELKSTQKVEGIVHAYTARTDADIGALRRGRQSAFVDPVDDALRYLREPFDDDGKSGADTKLFGPGTRSKSIVRRRGTLNGVGCGAGPLVASGYDRNFSDLPQEGRPSRYSSAGQGADPVRKRQPDVSFPTDESRVLSGMRAAGSRGGSTFRLVGTSSAAPQCARWVLEGAPPLKEIRVADQDRDGQQGRRGTEQYGLTE